VALLTSLFALGIPLTTAFAQAPKAKIPLHILILNGKTGKPVANEHVNIFSSSDYRNVAEFNTDVNGIISTSDIAPDLHAFYVAVDWHRQCTKKNPPAFSLQEVFAKGIVSENTCKPKFPQPPQPGALILFVRNETFFEKMSH
jgi:hypothetical protein